MGARILGRSTPNGTRTRATGVKGPRANRYTMGARRLILDRAEWCLRNGFRRTAAHRLARSFVANLVRRRVYSIGRIRPSTASKLGHSREDAQPFAGHLAEAGFRDMRTTHQLPTAA